MNEIKLSVVMDEESPEYYRINKVAEARKLRFEDEDFMETCQFIFEMGLNWCEENYDILYTID